MKRNKTWAKTVAITILVLPMILLFDSAANNAWLQGMAFNDYERGKKNIIEFFAIVGTGVGSALTSSFVYTLMTDNKNKSDR